MKKYKLVLNWKSVIPERSDSNTKGAPLMAYFPESQSDTNILVHCHPFGLSYVLEEHIPLVNSLLYIHAVYAIYNKP